MPDCDPHPIDDSDSTSHSHAYDDGYRDGNSYADFNPNRYLYSTAHLHSYANGYSDGNRDRNANPDLNSVPGMAVPGRMGEGEMLPVTELEQLRRRVRELEAIIAIVHDAIGGQR